MLVFSMFYQILTCVFSCNHLRTPINEGKCFCPDCGRGVIFQWVVLRCQTCRVRVDSKFRFRQVIPAQPCCPQCGESAFDKNFLESPAYFQLHKAQLLAREEEDYIDSRFGWSLRSMGEIVTQAVWHAIKQLEVAPDPVPVLAFLPKGRQEQFKPCPTTISTAARL